MPLLFASATFLGAFLLFCAQPMVARMVPAVWNTCMVFFQAAVLAGYGYVHAASGRLGVRRVSLIHFGLLVLPVLALPMAFPANGSGVGNPGLRMMVRLLTVAGLPIFVVAPTAPLLQCWFAATSHRREGDPYFLYAASNAGSLLALAGYVTLIEPTVAQSDQARLWAWGYGSLAILIAACAVALHRNPADSPDPVALRAEARRIAGRDRGAWVALAFVPSSLLLGVTTYLTTDLSPVPMIWVVPLMLYLLSYIVAFANLPAWVARG